MTDLPYRVLERAVLADSGGPSASRFDDTDTLSDVLSHVRLTGALLFLVDAAAPWKSHAPAADVIASALMLRARHLVSFHVIVEGRCWGGLTGQEPEPLAAGDVLVVPHGAPYFLAEPADAQPSYGAGEALAFFGEMAAGRLPSLISEGAGTTRTTRFICGFLTCDARPFNPVLDALPPVLYLRQSTAGARMAPLIDLAQRELSTRSSGSKEVLLRLSELMFVSAIRCHLDRVPVADGGWLAGLRDPVVARALALIHAAPERAWTLDSLTDQIGSSRSVFAERFTRIVGQSPMQYITAWRMQRAARLLNEPTAKVAAVARAVGYDSEAAFSRAFKKRVGLSPAHWRRERA